MAINCAGNVYARCSVWRGACRGRVRGTCTFLPCQRAEGAPGLQKVGHCKADEASWERQPGWRACKWRSDAIKCSKNICLKVRKDTRAGMVLDHTNVKWTTRMLGFICNSKICDPKASSSTPPPNETKKKLVFEQEQPTDPVLRLAVRGGGW
jgi:hypothetical protein